MQDIDLMETSGPLAESDLRQQSDRLLVMNEFAVAYQEPINDDSHRGYLTAWVRTDHHRNDDPEYTRKQGWSGDDDMMRGWLSEMAERGPDRIESFIGQEH